MNEKKNVHFEVKTINLNKNLNQNMLRHTHGGGGSFVAIESGMSELPRARLEHGDG